MELIIFAIILVVASLVNYAMWRNSRKRYEEYMKSVGALNAQLQKLLDDYDKLGKEVDEAENAMHRIDDEIEFEQELHRVILALNNKMTNFEN